VAEIARDFEELGRAMESRDHSNRFGTAKIPKGLAAKAGQSAGQEPVRTCRSATELLRHPLHALYQLFASRRAAIVASEGHKLASSWTGTVPYYNDPAKKQQPQAAGQQHPLPVKGAQNKD
jgi:hypothetical protein